MGAVLCVATASAPGVQMPMRSLYFNSVPMDFERPKNEEFPRQLVTGARVHAFELFRALLTHSNFDRIVLPYPDRNNTFSHPPAAAYAFGRQVEFLREDDLAGLKKSDSVVFLTPGPDIADLTRLRRQIGCRASPILGFIHSLYHPWMAKHLLLYALSDLHPHDALICSSNAGRTAIENLYRELSDVVISPGLSPVAPQYRLPVIPLGVFTEEFDAIEPTGGQTTSGPIILYFGRLSSTSKADWVPLLLAFREVLNSTSEAVLVMAGDDSLHHAASHIASIAAALSIGDRTRVIANPSRETKRQLYAAADVFVSPSDNLQETFGITLLEAMSAGLPAVVSRWSGYTDIVIQGETGFMVNTALPHFAETWSCSQPKSRLEGHDLLSAVTIVDWRQLAGYLSILLADRELRKRMGAAAKRRAKLLYDWSVIIGEYESLCEDLRRAAKSSSIHARGDEATLDCLDYSEAFSHYAGSRISLDSAVYRYGDPAEESLIISVISATAPWVKPDLLADILHRVGVPGGQTIGELLASKTGNVEDASYLAHVCRLLKYCIIRCGDER
jgi:D-inositol-3-phosphate glycosyltransferase